MTELKPMPPRRQKRMRINKLFGFARLDAVSRILINLSFLPTCSRFYRAVGDYKRVIFRFLLLFSWVSSSYKYWLFSEIYTDGRKDGQMDK